MVLRLRGGGGIGICIEAKDLVTGKMMKFDISSTVSSSGDVTIDMVKKEIIKKFSTDKIILYIKNEKEIKLKGSETLTQTFKNETFVDHEQTPKYLFDYIVFDYRAVV